MRKESTLRSFYDFIVKEE